MSKQNSNLVVEGFDDLIAKLGDLENVAIKAVEDGLSKSSNLVTSTAERAMTYHNDTGLTKKSLIKNPKVVWVGGTQASIDIGFDLTKPHGYVSIFLMYGTPRMKKDQFLYNAFYAKSVKEMVVTFQRESLESAIKKVGL